MALAERLQKMGQTGSGRTAEVSILLALILQQHLCKMLGRTVGGIKIIEGSLVIQLDTQTQLLKIIHLAIQSNSKFPLKRAACDV